MPGCYVVAIEAATLPPNYVLTTGDEFAWELFRATPRVEEVVRDGCQFSLRGQGDDFVHVVLLQTRRIAVRNGLAPAAVHDDSVGLRSG